MDQQTITNNEELISTEELEKMVAETMRDLKEGKIVKGKVYGVHADYVVVDIGYKSEGLIPLSEFEKETSLQIGDEIEVFLERLEDRNGIISISKQKADKLKYWETLLHTYHEGDTIKGKISRQVKGGMMVDIGLEAFLPASQIDIRYVKDKNSLIGQTHEFKILKINEIRRNIVLSRRELLEEKRSQARKELLAEIQEGDIREGVVKNITDFGVFIDLGGLDGLLHITDMTWGRVSHPSELLAVGDTVAVKILNYDREKQRVSLGLKQKTDNPWKMAAEKYPVGAKVKGRVVNLMPYGAFVELEDGIEGLVHISEFSWTRRINHPSELLAIGDIIEVSVLKVDPADEKVSLGIKQLEFNPWSEVDKKYQVGGTVKGKIRNMAPYGVFLELEEGIDGLIHVSDMSWTRKITHPSQLFKRGDKVEASVLAVDQEKQKISLGIKQLTPDPWQEVDRKYQVDEVVKGTITKVAGFGVFMELDSGIEGLIHISQLSDKPFDDINDIISEGDKVEARVISIDKKERKISLSIKNALDGTSLDAAQKEIVRKSVQVEDVDTRFADALDKQLNQFSLPPADEKPEEIKNDE